VSKETAKYAINKDLTIERLHSFSSPEGNEFAYDIDGDELMSIHPHAIALKAALARRGSTEYQYSVGLSKLYGAEICICLTCENPDDEIGYSQEQSAIIEEAGLALYDGILDEAGDHALVNGRHADRAGVLCGVVEMSAQHTPGRVTFRDDGDANHWSLLTADGRWLLALLHNGEAPSERQAANFRRLAACWNACEGISTDALERLGTLDRARVDLDVIRAQAIAQRDELLEALRMVMACAGDISAAPDGLLEMALDDGDEETRRQANAFLVARAAIAKVKGGVA